LNLTSAEAQAKLDADMVRTNTVIKSLIQNVAWLNESGTAAMTRAKKSLEEMETALEEQIQANAKRTNISFDIVEQKLRANAARANSSIRSLFLSVPPSGCGGTMAACLPPCTEKYVGWMLNLRVGTVTTILMCSAANIGWGRG
jgi:hypothetical protein